jgi:phosphoenolpyruvate carboxylase
MSNNYEIPDRAGNDKLGNTSDSNALGTLNDTIVFFRDCLSEVLKQHNPKVLELFDRIISFSQQTLEKQNYNLETNQSIEDGFETNVTELLDGQEIELLTELSVALNCFFHLTNLAEESSRIERLTEYESSKDEVGFSNSFAQAYKKLLNDFSQKYADDKTQGITFHPVFTAHPTEARRPSTNQSIKRIQGLIARRPNLIGLTLLENKRQILSEIETMYLSSPINYEKPTVEDEIDSILNVFTETFYDSIPKVYRRISDFRDYILNNGVGIAHPLEYPIVTLGSWVGSDRDGNPNVNNNITESLCDKYFKHIVHLYSKDFLDILSTLTLDSKALKLSDDCLILATTFGLDTNNSTHSDLIASIRLKLKELKYNSPDEIVADLRIIQKSLVDNNSKLIAYDKLQILIWKIQTFGFIIFHPEIRQHSAIHQAAIDNPSDPKSIAIYDTFTMIKNVQAKYGRDSLNRYIISFSHHIDDFTNLFTIAKTALGPGYKDVKLNIIPLFETLEDLDNSVNILNQALELQDFQSMIKSNGGKLEIMVGYSDSSKDIGPIAASFLTDNVSRRLGKWAHENNINLTLFHGRGGAVGRGGGPAKKAIMSSPKYSVNNIFKLTEQGESIMARYGNPTLAVRHFENILSSILLQSNTSIAEQNEEMAGKYQCLSDDLSKYSSEKYLKFIKRDDITDYFCKVTPLDDISALNIGSRPSKRGLSANSFDDLRAIPWVFSWSQARLNLAAWYGFGTACKKVNLQDLQVAYKEWALFRSMIDNLEMSIAKTNVQIAELFLDLGENSELKTELIEELQLTQQYILDITGSKELLQTHKVLASSVKTRAPYLNALSLIQVYGLKRIKEQAYKNDKELESLRYLIRCSISGVAAGLQNTG